MEKSRPLISCIIPTLNRALLLKEAIESTISQTLNNWELIIVDDGSSDNTEQIVNEYIKKESRIRYYKNDKKGQASARNYGLVKSKGQYIAFLDDDDVSLPHRFESQLKAAQKSGNKFIVSGYQVRNRKNGKLISEHKLELKGKGAGFPSRWLISKELLNQAGGFKEDYPSMEELELSYRLSFLETFALHNEVVTILYPTENSVSCIKENNIKGMVLLMDQLGHEMIPIEAAWWYFNIGISYYSLDNKEAALNYFKKASTTSEMYNFKLCYILVDYSPVNNVTIKKINLKILQLIGDHRFPILINHSIVK